MCIRRREEWIHHAVVLVGPAWCKNGWQKQSEATAKRVTKSLTNVRSYLEQHAKRHGDSDDPSALNIDLFASFQFHLAGLAHFFTNVRV